MRIVASHITTLKKGGLAVLPTDTIYGVVGQALRRETVKRLYAVRRRSPKKPFIVLIAALSDLKKFGIVLSSSQKAFCARVWPGKVSVVLPCRSGKFSYLHRGTGSLAFRMPATISLRALIKKTGPLVAPSANPEGLPPAQTITQAKEYFKDAVDAYISGGRRDAKPSTLVSFVGKSPVVLRPGAVTLRI